MVAAAHIRYHWHLYFFAILLFPVSLWSQKHTELTSPDGQIVFTLHTEDGPPTYSIEFQKILLIDKSLMSVHVKDIGTLQQAYLEKPAVFKEINETYKLIVGKANPVQNRARQVILWLGDRRNPNYHIGLEVRTFNDGVAFRYLFVGKKGTAFTLHDEKTEFRFPKEPVVKALILPNFTSSHEGLYTTESLSKIKEDTLMDMPALFRFPENIYLAITEAALDDYAGMYLVKRNGVVRSQLSPLPAEPSTMVKATYPHKSPWRVLMISQRIGALLESNILTSLNEPSAIKDHSWIKPGTSTFPWWNGTVIPPGIKGGNNFETNKYYIDFCAANNITYHTIVEYDGHEWYTNDAGNYQPGPNTDITKPVDGLDMKKICDYGKQKNVGIRVWTHWKALYPKLDEAFALFEKWGLSGMMVDFMDRDDQEMVNIQMEILRKAAAHHLHIQFHGAYKPTGLHRTWPNEFTREGTLNYEHHKWDDLVTPNADLDIAFTRLLAGSTDYHLGGFRALPFKKFVVSNTRPFSIGTRCHMLAMYIVLENYLPMVGDDPEAYNNQPGFEVLKQLPGTWDETKVPAAEVDRYVSIARRSGTKWYIGTINDSTARQLDIDLSFIGAGDYTATVYSDAPDSHEHGDHLTTQSMTVNSNIKLRVVLAPGGGNLIILNKK
ncbi:MAG: glycoside hydrolase family 97 protein [Chitinophagaceae bacterium]|nr:glycoside hydrolase family 97 protein [Chitinophagaceae bacterium]